MGHGTDVCDLLRTRVAYRCPDTRFGTARKNGLPQMTFPPRTAAVRGRGFGITPSMEDPFMRGKRYTRQQIIATLREVDSGRSVAQKCRHDNVAEATIGAGGLGTVAWTRRRCAGWKS